MTSKEMMKETCKPGYWFVNKAALGETPNWEQEIEPYKEMEGLLFGYEEKEFMARQYRK